MVGDFGCNTNENVSDPIVGGNDGGTSAGMRSKLNLVIGAVAVDAGAAFVVGVVILLRLPNEKFNCVLPETKTN